MQELEYESETGSPDVLDADSDPSAGTGSDVESSRPTDATSGATVVDLPSSSANARLRLPADATEPEVAAIVSAVVARLRQAEAAEGDATGEPESTDPWQLAGRLGVRRRYELPRRCPRGSEWAAASRCP
jgi:hypothetical protein